MMCFGCGVMSPPPSVGQHYRVELSSVASKKSTAHRVVRMVGLIARDPPTPDQITISITQKRSRTIGGPIATHPIGAFVCTICCSCKLLLGTRNADIIELLHG